MCVFILVSNTKTSKCLSPVLVQFLKYADYICSSPLVQDYANIETLNMNGANQGDVIHTQGLSFSDDP